MRYLVLAALAAALIGCATARADVLPAPLPDDTDSLVFSTGVVDTLEPDPDGGITTFDSLTGASYPSGCRQVDLYAIAKSILFHTTIYKFHQIKYWCWHQGIVYNERHAWSFDGSSTACLDTVYPANSWFFTWKWGKAQSGHFSQERAHVTNCVFRIGSWNELYPDVKIWAHADGSYDQAVDNG
jgi:hypothetical protein